MEYDINDLDQLITKIESQVDYVDIRAGKGNGTSIVMKDDKIQEINSGLTNGARIRVLNNGAWGFAFTNDLSKLEEVSKTAIKISNSLKSDVKMSDADVIEDDVKTPRKIPVSSVDINEKIDLIKDTNDAAKLDKIINATVNYSDSETESVFLNSEGTNIHMEETRLGMFLNVIASNGELIQIGHDSLGGAKGYEVLKNADIEAFGRNVAESAIRLLDAKAAPSGRFPIITDNTLTGVMIHEALGHAVESDLILQDDSILKDKMNTKIGSDIVNIYDDPTMDAFGHYEYDTEGVKTFKNHLVKDGELVSLLSSRESAGKLKMKSSGNARSSMEDQPIVRMSNTYLQPGDMSFDELIEDIKDGIYLKGSRGGQVDTGKGIFQFNATEAFKIENGELTTPLRDVSLSGNILETLKHIDGLGSDFKTSVGFCGKDGQIAPVGDGGPHTRIQDAIVGGSQ
ncbi:MAG: TldD/PmbA family protein [Methanobrevibacter sp.]